MVEARSRWMEFLSFFFSFTFPFIFHFFSACLSPRERESVCVSFQYVRDLGPDTLTEYHHLPSSLSILFRLLVLLLLFLSPLGRTPTIDGQVD